MENEQNSIRNSSEMPIFKQPDTFERQKLVGNNGYTGDIFQSSKYIRLEKNKLLEIYNEQQNTLSKFHKILEQNETSVYKNQIGSFCCGLCKIKII